VQTGIVPKGNPFGPPLRQADRTATPHSDNFRVADNSPGTVRMLFPGRELTVGEGSALSDLDNVTVRIADVAANLAVLGDRFSDELGSSTFP
jgi:hypothetical protein